MFQRIYSSLYLNFSRLLIIGFTFTERIEDAGETTNPLLFSSNLLFSGFDLIWFGLCFLLLRRKTFSRFTFNYLASSSLSSKQPLTQSRENTVKSRRSHRDCPFLIRQTFQTDTSLIALPIPLHINHFNHLSPIFLVKYRHYFIPLE